MWKSRRVRDESFYELPSGEACYFEAGDQLYLSFGDGVRALSRPGLGCALFSVVESEPVNLFMASHLMFTIVLVEMLKRRGCYSMHSAGFSKGGKAILIPGTSGAGKSTLAITLLRSGFGYLSDDMVFLRRGSDGLGVLGFPGGRRRKRSNDQLFPRARLSWGVPKTRGWPKRQVRADEVYGVGLVLGGPTGSHRNSANCRQGNKRSEPIDADEALAGNGFQRFAHGRSSCQSHLDILTELVRQTPCYRLETGRDFDRIPVLLGELLSGSREEIHA